MLTYMQNANPNFGYLKNMSISLFSLIGISNLSNPLERHISSKYIRLFSNRCLIISSSDEFVLDFLAVSFLLNL